MWRVFCLLWDRRVNPSGRLDRIREWGRLESVYEERARLWVSSQGGALSFCGGPVLQLVALGVEEINPVLCGGLE